MSSLATPAPRRGAELLLGVDGQPLIYPAPVILRNTFVDVQMGRPLSLEGFFEERQAHSCPTSLVSEAGSYVPGAQFMKSAALNAQQNDVESDCSTADTAEDTTKNLTDFKLSSGNTPTGPKAVLRLETALPGPVLGSLALPSVGSIGHQRRECKPCAFVAKKGCASGEQCNYCHLCDPGEKKRRQKDKRQHFALRRLQQLATGSARHA